MKELDTCNNVLLEKYKKRIFLVEKISDILDLSKYQSLIKQN